MHLLIDSHEDIAYNMLTFGRDYTRSVAETRRLESGRETILHNGDTLLGLPEFRRGGVAVAFATLFCAPARLVTGAWDTQSYTDFEQAHRLYRAQMDVYYRIVDEHPDAFTLIRTRQEFQAHWQRWQDALAQSQSSGEPFAPALPLGLTVLMEGAEGVRSPQELEEWWQLGVRTIGPAWAGTRFCGGTREPGPLTREGVALLEAMADLGFTLDISHMDQASALQALDMYPGPIIATHANALALMKGSESNRHLSDRVLRGFLARGGVVGIVPFNKFLKAGWMTGDRRELVTLQQVVAQLDYVCQMAGNARHVGLGTDFDGGFGLQSTPVGIDTIADLQKLAPLLAEKGYSEIEITAILGGNWAEHLQQHLPTG